jgi:hypothetical protein
MNKAEELHIKRREAGVLTHVKEHEKLDVLYSAFTDLRDRRMSYRERKLKERSQMLKGVENNPDVIREVKMSDTKVKATLADMKNIEDKVRHSYMSINEARYWDSLLLRTMLIDMLKTINKGDIDSVKKTLSSINLETEEILETLGKNEKEWYKEIIEEDPNSSQKSSDYIEV